MEQQIMTPCGEIKGTTCQWEGVTAFKGIRYATAGRFAYPQIVTKWEGIYNASKYGNCSYQPRAFYDEANMPEKAFYYNEFRRGRTYTYSEDCLFLNIWVPQNAKTTDKLPVLLYIHGGGFTGGCGHEKHFDGPVWAAKGVVAVTINYRLGPLGFACLPELKAEAGHTGNYGLYDQMAAMQWVKANIESFGGDAENITIMGQSAGAMSVQRHCVSPLTDGLFQKAVMSSGGGIHPMFDVNDTEEDRYPFWQSVMEQAGCSTLAEFRSITPKKLFEAWNKVKSENPKGAMAAFPCLDGAFLSESALAVTQKGMHKNIPYMMGSTSHDIVPPYVFQMAKDWCIEQAKQGKQDSYCWFFDRKLPGDENGAWHSSDLWYWFGTLENGWRPFTQLDKMLSDKMTDYLCNFAKSGNPNGEGLVEWTPVKAEEDFVLHWGEEGIGMSDVDMELLHEIMKTNIAVGE
uniref:carboxylesterase/lipase family protein n=1 Tax=Agathobacter sp. TaxID=2021311 RepID=UPI0040569156